MSANLECHVFLVVDHNADTRFLLVKCLLRKFSAATILEADTTEAALSLARHPDLAAIVSHRTTEMLGVELVVEFRKINPTIPIVMVSGIERTTPALAAGADRFLLFDEWLRIGTVVQDLLRKRESDPEICHVDLTKTPG
jgi:CheY-like chemotaxis protein